MNLPDRAEVEQWRRQAQYETHVAADAIAQVERLQEALRHVRKKLEDVAMIRGGHGVFAETYQIVTDAIAGRAGPVAGGLVHAARRVTSFLDHANLDTSVLPTGMGSALRSLHEEVIRQRTPAAADLLGDDDG